MIRISGGCSTKGPTTFPGIYFAPVLSFWQALFHLQPQVFFVETFLIFLFFPLHSTPLVLAILKLPLQLNPNSISFQSSEHSRICPHKRTQCYLLYLSKPVLATIENSPADTSAGNVLSSQLLNPAPPLSLNFWISPWTNKGWCKWVVSSWLTALLLLYAVFLHRQIPKKMFSRYFNI